MSDPAIGQGLLRRVAFRGFRNLRDAEIFPSSRFTLLVGPNGAGKTNLLEAVYFVSSLRSFRVATPAPLIGRDVKRAEILATTDDVETELETELRVILERSDAGTRRQSFVDGKLVRLASEFYGRLATIIFTPEDLNVVRGSPSDRRQLIDRALFGRDKRHLMDISAYERVLRSRNHVLRQPHPRAVRDGLLDAYDHQLSELGARIWSRRIALTDRLRPDVVRTFEEVQGTQLPVSLRYISMLGDIEPESREGVLIAELRRQRARDEERGTTSVGPHRDDLAFELDGQPAASFASQGQTRTIALAFKLAELRAATVDGPRPPLLLLDDVSSELDPARSERLFDHLTATNAQCVLTTTASHFIPIPRGVSSTTYEVLEGVLRPTRSPE